LDFSQTNYKNFFEDIPLGVVITHEGRIKYVNEFSYGMLGYTENELLGQPFLPLVCDADQPFIADLHQRRMKGEKVDPNYIIGMVRKDGVIRQWHFKTSTIKWDGKLAGLGIVTDITEREQMAAALKASEEQFRTLANLAPVGIYLSSPDGRCQYANQAISEMTGKSPDDLLDDGWLDCIHPDDRAAVAANWQPMVESSGRWGFEYRFLTPSGKITWVHGLASPQRDALGNVVAYVGITTDITERKQAEAELVAAKTAADSANRAKSNFLANMSHEIRTPMNAIMGMTSILRRSGVTPLQADKLAKIDTASAHLLSIINDILDISKIEAGKMILEETPVTIDSLVDNINSMLSERARNKGVNLLIEIGSMPSNLIGDTTRLQQAMLNYVTNAIKFTDRGTITLRIRLQEEAAESALVRIEVEDSGVGIPPEALSRLFNAFEQADNSTTRKYGGTGLGLAITRRLAELMGGSYGAESTVGVGSTFWFSARLKKQERRKADREEDLLNTHAETTLRRQYLGFHVLIADDDPINREVAQILLEDVGLVVATAEDGQEAIAMAGKSAYAAIFMDMQMPNINGLDATRKIRLIPGYERIPIIATTANAHAEDRKLCLDAGMDDCLIKPFLPADLFSMALKWLAQHSG
jgi:PAS domain S-box-containing protein